MSLSSEERNAWKRAIALFDEISDQHTDTHDHYLQDASLDALVRANLRALLKADSDASPLDAELEQVGVKNAESIDVDQLEGRKIGDWTLESALGQGGSALVYLATRELPRGQQTAALKLLPIGLRGSKAVARFEREQGLLAGLSHPQIATFLDAGVDADGTPYLVTEFIDGQTLDLFIASRNLSERERVALLRDTCRAVAHAHRSLVVHLDLKPGNVIVDEAGHVTLLDFGIGQLLHQVDGQTVTRAFTPSYAAPEQFSGQGITTATDVYALGVMLFRSLTGESKFASAAPKMGADLRNIARKAVSEDPEGRYTNAQELAEDLDRYLSGRPVEATAPSLSYRARLWVRRNPWSSVFAAGMLAAIGLGVTGVLWQAQVASQRAVDAEAAAAQARLEGRRAQQASDLLMNLFAGADPELQLGRTLTARQLVDQAAASLAADSSLDPAVADPLHLALANVYRSLGEYRSSGEQVSAAESLRGTPDWIIEQANTLRRQGQLLQAEELYSEVIQAELSPKLRATVLLNYAEVSSSLARFDQADQLYEAALVSYAEQPDPQKIAVLSSRADHFTNQGEFASALEMIDRAEHLQKSNASQVLEAKLSAQRGSVYIESGEFDLARAALANAESNYQSIYEPSHPAVLQVQLLRASLHRAEGDHEVALELASQIVASAEASLGDHPITVEALNTLGLLEFDAGDMEPALDRLGAGVDMMESIAGETHPDVAVLRANLSFVNRLNGDSDEAWVQAQRAFEIHRKTLPEHHPDTLHSRAHFAHGLRGRGELAAALVEYQALATIVDQTYGLDHRQAVGTHVNVSSLLRQLGRYGEALVHAKIAHDAAVPLFPADSPTVQAVRASLTQSHLDNNEVQHAQELMESLSPLLGSTSERPSPRIVLMEGQIAAANSDWTIARDRLAMAERLMDSRPDGGSRYRKDLTALQELVASAR